jgi:zinc transporter ZupT
VNRPAARSANIGVSRRRQRDKLWKPALNVSVCCAVAGLLFVLIGAWLAAWLTFALGALAAAAAALLLRRESRAALRRGAK